MGKPVLRVLEGGRGAPQRPRSRSTSAVAQEDSPLFEAYSKLLVLELREQRISAALNTASAATEELLRREARIQISCATAKKAYCAVLWDKGPWTLRDTVVKNEIWTDFMRVATELLICGNYRSGREVELVRRRIVEAGESYRVAFARAPSCLQLGRAKVLPVHRQKAGKRGILLVPKQGPSFLAADRKIDSVGDIEPGLWREMIAAADKNFSLGYGDPA